LRFRPQALDSFAAIAARLPVKILFCSYLFAPSVGGVETVGRLLAHEFEAAGHEIRIVTNTPGEQSSSILRRPTVGALWESVRCADVIFHNNVSLRYAWPVLIAKKPWVIAHHTWLRRPDGTKGAPERLKELCVRRAHNIAVSRAIARALPGKARVIGNPYDAASFRVRKEIPRTRDLIFVGRLVSDKGADLLLEAMHRIRSNGPACELTVVGEGPELPRLQAQTEQLGLARQVRFAGVRVGEELSKMLNEHRVLVVPSRWDEPFGLVALEGIASGCAVIGTRGGGLASAIGPCGVTVPNGDVNALAAEIERLVRNPELTPTYLVKAEAHLKQHHPATVAERYLEVFEEARRK
jgi:glycogen synthase